VRPGHAGLRASSTAATIAVTVSQFLENHGNDSNALQLQRSKDFGGSAAKLPVSIEFRRPPNPRFDSCAPPLNFTSIPSSWSFGTDDHALLNPTMRIEVLSPSTKAYDRGLKASHYRRIPSLQAYLLVTQDRQRLELQTRQPDGHWLIVEAGPGERLSIEPLGVELEVDAVYRDALTA
jgi:Uma2 family endonuclease